MNEHRCLKGRKINYITQDYMIRKHQPADLPSILNIWLKSNLEAHSFIPSTYWVNHLGFYRN